MLIKMGMKFPQTKGPRRPKSPEKREDFDGGFYSKAEFLQAYGGLEEWHRAGEKLKWPKWALELSRTSPLATDDTKGKKEKSKKKKKKKKNREEVDESAKEHFTKHKTPLILLKKINRRASRSQTAPLKTASVIDFEERIKQHYLPIKEQDHRDQTNRHRQHHHHHHHHHHRNQRRHHHRGQVQPPSYARSNHEPERHETVPFNGRTARLVGGDVASTADLMKLPFEQRAASSLVWEENRTESIEERAPRLRAWLKALRLGPGADAKLLYFMTSESGGEITDPRELRIIESKKITAAASLVAPLKRGTFLSAAQDILDGKSDGGFKAFNDEANRRASLLKRSAFGGGNDSTGSGARVTFNVDQHGAKSSDCDGDSRSDESGTDSDWSGSTIEVEKGRSGRSPDVTSSARALQHRIHQLSSDSETDSSDSTSSRGSYTTHHSPTSFGEKVDEVSDDDDEEGEEEEGDSNAAKRRRRRERVKENRARARSFRREALRRYRSVKRAVQLRAGGDWGRLMTQKDVSDQSGVGGAAGGASMVANEWQQEMNQCVRLWQDAHWLAAHPTAKRGDIAKADVVTEALGLAGAAGNQSKKKDGDDRALHALGNLHHLGRGVQRNLKLAKRYYHHAVEVGKARLSAQLESRTYQRRKREQSRRVVTGGYSDDEENDGAKVHNDFDGARGGDFFSGRIVIGKGAASALCALGMLEEARNPAKAMALYESAATSGSKQGIYNLANMQRRRSVARGVKSGTGHGGGRGSVLSLEEIADLYARAMAASKMGHVKAAYNLGAMLEAGMLDDTQHVKKHEQHHQEHHQHYQPRRAPTAPHGATARQVAARQCYVNALRAVRKEEVTGVASNTGAGSIAPAADVIAVGKRAEALDRTISSAAPPPLLHRRVVVVGVQNRPEINGCTGIASAFDASRAGGGRYVVALDEGGGGVGTGGGVPSSAVGGAIPRAVKLRPRNLALEPKQFNLGIIGGVKPPTSSNLPSGPSPLCEDTTQERV